jgi:DnaJ-class molecular chaperone
MNNIVTCSKCKGSGKYHFNNGMIGQCYNCDGIGKLKQIAHKQYTISIIDCDGIRIQWIHVNANTEQAAIKKAKEIALRGCYKDNVDTIQAIEEGVKYTYTKIKK